MSGTDAPLAIRPTLVPGAPAAIRMSAPEQVPGRRARRILGGLLASESGELAFELTPGPDGRTRLTVALRAFRPRMPLFVYLRTQRRLHERSTFAFLREVAASS